MDLTSLSAEEKLQKYNDYNVMPEQSGGVEYIPNELIRTQDPEIDYTSKIPPSSPFLTYANTKKIEAFNPLTEQNPMEAIKQVSNKAVPIKRLSIGMNLKGNAKEIEKSIDTLKIDDDDKYFLKVLANRESSFNPKASITDNKGRTYTGLYQFGAGALASVGMTRKEYMEDIGKQHLAALKFGEQNIKGLEKYVGQTVKGVKVTKAGMMAAAHLGGRGGLQALLEGKERKDMLGTSTLDYLKMFEK